MTRILTGLTPTGPLHLGSYLNALRPAARAVAAGANRDDVLLMVADLHALTVEHDPASLATTTLEHAAVAVASGLDPDRCTVFVQSHVPEHRAMHYLLEALTGTGEATRMIQFKTKSSSSGRLALLTYPVLMAADILLHGTGEVPVGQDQAQHLELARGVAQRANHRYGTDLVVPRAVHQPVARRLMDLQDPTRKMSKSGTGAGTLGVLDDPDVLRRKVHRAVTDDEGGPGSVRYDPEAKPGVSNLLELLAACTGLDPRYAARSLDTYAELKDCVAQTVVETLAPVRTRALEVLSDPAPLRAALREGAARAQMVAAPVLRDLEARMGLLPATT